MLFLSFVAHAQTDTLKLKPDSLVNSATSKIDSLQKGFENQSGSIRLAYTQQTEKIENLKNRWQHQADSLNNLQLPSVQYTHKIDSITQRQSALQQRTTAKLDSLKDSVKNKLAKLKVPKEAEGKASALTSSLDKANVPAFDADITGKLGLNKLNASLPAGSLPNTNLPDANVPAINTSIPGTDLKSPDVTGNLPATGVNTNKVTGITGQAGAVQQQVKEATGSTEGMEKAVESKASEQLKNLPDKNLPAQGLSGVEVPKTGDQAKEQLMNQAKKEAVNHFSGKEQVLVTAMEKMSKYKQKYSSVSSMKDLEGKKNHNELKGKPLRERLVPAITWQFQSWHDLMLDINPAVGYKITPRLITGIGWNHRIAFNIPQQKFNQEAKVYGFRAYGEYELKKGFGFRLDVETMNTPAKQRMPATDVYKGRDWVWGALVGIKQKYPIYKKLKGNAQLMYNIFDKDHRSPYPDRINFRIGIEFTFKKKKQEEKKQTGA